MYHQLRWRLSQGHEIGRFYERVASLVLGVTSTVAYRLSLISVVVDSNFTSSPILFAFAMSAAEAEETQSTLEDGGQGPGAPTPLSVLEASDLLSKSY